MDEVFFFFLQVSQCLEILLESELNLDEVYVERLIQKYRDDGELNSEDPALVMLKTWPTSRQYKDKPDKLPGLQRLVILICVQTTCYTCEFLKFFLCHLYGILIAQPL